MPARRAKKAFTVAGKNNALALMFSQDMAEKGAVKRATFDVITKFHNGRIMSAEDAPYRLLSFRRAPR